MTKDSRVASASVTLRVWAMQLDACALDRLNTLTTKLTKILTTGLTSAYKYCINFAKTEFPYRI